jgi:hypothetical protein
LMQTVGQGERRNISPESAGCVHPINQLTSRISSSCPGPISSE